MIFRSVLSNWVGLVVLGVISFILTPILIHALGELYFGMWVLVSSLVDYYGLMDIGLRATVQRYVAHLRGSKDQDGLNQTIATALVFTLGISAIIFVSVFGLSWALPHFFKLRGSSIPLFRWLVILMGVDMALTLPARLVGTLICSFERFDLYNLNGIVAGIVRAVLLVGALWLGYGVLGVAAVTLAVTSFSIPFLWWLLKRAEPGLLVLWRKANWARARQLVSFSFFVSLNTVGYQLRNYTDALVIGRMLSVALVTSFNVATRLMEYFRQVLTGFTGPLLPAFSGLEGRNRAEDVRGLFLVSTRITITLSTFIASMLLLNGREFLRFWVGAKYISSYPILAILTIGTVVSLAQGPSTVLLIARGRHKFLGILTLCEGITNLFLSIYWARPYGLLGVALGTTVPMLVSSLAILPWYVMRVASITFREYFKSALARPLAAALIFAAVGFAAYRVWPEPNIFAFLSLLTIESLLFAVLAYILCFGAPERQALLAKGKHLAVVLRVATLYAKLG